MSVNDTVATYDATCPKCGVKMLDLFDVGDGGLSATLHCQNCGAYKDVRHE